MPFQKAKHNINLSSAPEGYDRLAKIMSDVPDFAIFKRFLALSAESLLLQQAELCELAGEIRRIQAENKGSSVDDRAQYHRDWYYLQAAGGSDAGTGNDGTQWQKMLEFRAKIKDYHEALNLFHATIKLKPPNAIHLKSLVTWMERPSMGNVWLTGEDRHTWSQPDMQDLTCVGADSSDGMMASTISLKIVGFYHRILGRFVHGEEEGEHFNNSILYRDDGVFSVLKAVRTVTASLLPIVGIVILFFVQDVALRLGITAILTALFSLTLTLVTNAQLKDIFSATAAFAAILVVFIGTSNKSGS